MTVRQARLAALPFILYALYSSARDDLRVELVLAAVAVIVLAYLGPRSRELLGVLYPFGLVGLLYDGMRPIQTLGLTEARVHLCDLRALEVSLFGRHGKTIHDYFVVHHSTALDLFCAIPYGTFIPWCMVGAVLMVSRDKRAMYRFAWGFFLLNLMAFVTYHLLPAAPPWYFHAHGCTVDLSTRASEGPALARVDAYLGIRYFHGMYAKASSVFGALPSLHCAYPTLLAIEGWRVFGPKMRLATVLYALTMIFSAMYLDHHWGIDASLGVLYACIVAVGLRLSERTRATVVRPMKAHS